jgi:hypothetical protein
VSILRVGYPSETVLLFGCDASSLNAFGGWTKLPQRLRHLEGDIYAFVDGHAKMDTAKQCVQPSLEALKF